VSFLDGYFGPSTSSHPGVQGLPSGGRLTTDFTDKYEKKRRNARSGARLETPACTKTNDGADDGQELTFVIVPPTEEESPIITPRQNTLRQQAETRVAEPIESMRKAVGPPQGAGWCRRVREARRPLVDCAAWPVLPARNGLVRPRPQSRLSSNRGTDASATSSALPGSRPRGTRHRPPKKIAGSSPRPCGRDRATGAPSRSASAQATKALRWWRRGDRLPSADNPRDAQLANRDPLAPCLRTSTAKVSAIILSTNSSTSRSRSQRRRACLS